MITDHAYVGELRSGASCQFIYTSDEHAGPSEVCARQAMEHAKVEDNTPSEESFPIHHIFRDGEAVLAKALGSNAGLRGKATSPEAEALEEIANGSIRNLGEFSTRELLEELQLRGDLAMTVMPTTERGADGSILSAFGSAGLRALTLETLEANRGE